MDAHAAGNDNTDKRGEDVTADTTHKQQQHQQTAAGSPYGSSFSNMQVRNLARGAGSNPPRTNPTNNVMPSARDMLSMIGNFHQPSAEGSHA